MKKSKAEDYYDRVELLGNFHQSGILGLLREKLIVFEVHREEATLKMIPRGIDKMLDVACKNGSLLINASDKFRHAFGVDISGKAIEQAGKDIRGHGLSNKISLRKADFENGLPFKANYFDLVTCIAILEHLFDPEKAILEAKRVLRKGGYLIVEVPNVAWLPLRLSLLFGSRPRTSWAPGWDGGHLNYFTFGSLEELLEKSGFKVLKTGCSGVFAGLRYIYPSLLSGDIIILARKK